MVAGSSYTRERTALRPQNEVWVPHEDVSVYLGHSFVHMGQKFVQSEQFAVIMSVWRTGM
jgi:hypothetical protein